MKIWDIKARLFHIRRLWPLCLILDKENANVLTLLSGLELGNMIVLDIGCGTGNAFELLPECTRAVGLDASFEMCRRTRQYHKVPVVQGDANFMPFRGGFVDLVLSVGLLEYQHDWTHLLKELTALVNNHGYLLVTSTPAGVFTLLRRLHGIPLMTTLPIHVIEEAQKQGMVLINQRHSLMQDQYLFQKLKL